MSKYTQAELLQMVDVVVEAKRRGDARYPQVLMVLSMYTEDDPRDIENRILKIHETRVFK